MRLQGIISLAAGLWLASALACGRTPEPPGGNAMEQTESWDVYKEGRAVLRIRKGPGPLLSRGMLPPGAKIPQHPFVSAASLDAVEEDSVRRLLEKARDFEDFVRLLRSAGYTVSPSR